MVQPPFPPTEPKRRRWLIPAVVAAVLVVALAAAAFFLLPRGTSYSGVGDSGGGLSFESHGGKVAIDYEFKAPAEGGCRLELIGLVRGSGEASTSHVIDVDVAIPVKGTKTYDDLPAGNWRIVFDVIRSGGQGGQGDADCPWTVTARAS